MTPYSFWRDAHAGRHAANDPERAYVTREQRVRLPPGDTMV
jgi:hypothetical protein